MADVDAFHEGEALGKAYDARLMKRLVRYLTPYRWQVALAILVLMIASATQVVGPWLTQLILDEAIPREDGEYLALLAGGFLAAILLGVVLQYAQAIITTWLGQSVMYDLRAEIFEKLQRLDLRYYDKNPVGRLMTRMTNDVETLNDLFSFSISVDVGMLADKRLKVARDLMDKSGTPLFRAEELKQEWFRLGSDFSIGVSDHETTVTISGLDENFDDVDRLDAFAYAWHFNFLAHEASQRVMRSSD